MLWRTLTLSAVNVVTVLMVFVPIAQVVSAGMEDTYYLHSSSPPYFFIVQLALGLFAVIIDMLNAKPHLQSKLLAGAIALSGALVGVTLWMVSNADHVGCFSQEYEIRAGAWLPVFNVMLFGAVWIDQRKRSTK